MRILEFKKSKIGFIFALSYFLFSIYLINSQGLFGESFIAILLGFPWSFLIIYFGFNTFISDISLYLWILTPIIINIILFYLVGGFIERKFRIKI